MQTETTAQNLQVKVGVVAAGIAGVVEQVCARIGRHENDPFVEERSRHVRSWSKGELEAQTTALRLCAFLICVTTQLDRGKHKCQFGIGFGDVYKHEHHQKTKCENNLVDDVVQLVLAVNMPN